MRTLANILWHFPFLGFLSAISTFLLGGLLVVTVIGSPIGFGLIELSKFLFSPFSSAMISKKELSQPQNKLWKTYGLIVRILYFPFGLFLAISVIIQIAALFISLIGIPVALVLAKSLSTYFNPVDKKCVPKSVALELERRRAIDVVNRHLGVNPVTQSPAETLIEQAEAQANPNISNPADQTGSYIRPKPDFIEPSTGTDVIATKPETVNPEISHDGLLIQKITEAKENPQTVTNLDQIQPGMEEKVSPSAGKAEDINATGTGLNVSESRFSKGSVKVVILIVVSAIVLICIFILALKPNPTKDGKQAAAQLCECQKKYTSKLLPAYDEFLTGFSEYNFTNAIEANEMLRSINGPYESELLECISETEQNIDGIQRKHANNLRYLDRFKQSIESYECNDADMEAYNGLLDQINFLISELGTNEVTIEKIKTDLIGQVLLGWHFQDLAEFSTAEIVNVQNEGNDVRYQIRFKLKDQVSQIEREFELAVIYVKQGGWQLQKIVPIWITNSYLIDQGQWVEVKVPANCKVEVINNSYNLWFKDGYYGQRRKISHGDVVLPHTQQLIYCKSDEKSPITLNVRYTANE